MSAETPEFYIGEFLNLFKDAAVAQVRIETAQGMRTLENVQAAGPRRPRSSRRVLMRLERHTTAKLSTKCGESGTPQQAVCRAKMISDLMGGSGRRFLQALADGERSPAALAALGDYRLHASKAELAEALTGRFRDIHGFEIGMLLKLIDDLSAKITELDERIEAQLENVPGLGGVCTSCGQPGPDGPCTGCGEPVLGVIARLDEITGIGRGAAQVIVAELGTDMTQFPTPGHAASWAKLTPRAIQSGATSKAGRTGKGNPYLRGATGVAVMTAARTETFLGARYRRHARRRGKQEKAIVAGCRTIIEIAWRVIAGPGFRYIELGPDYHDQLDPGRKTRDKIRQLEKLNPGMTVTLTPRPEPGGQAPAA